MLGNDGGQGDAAGLCGEDHGDLVHVEVLAELFGDVIHQFGVDAVIQKTVYLDDIAGKDLALLDDSVFQLLHWKIPLVFF